MKTFEYEVKDELGLHARPAGLLVKEAKNFKSQITVSNGAKKAMATQLMMIMAMAVKKGTTVTVTVEGEDEEIAFDAMQKFFQENL